MRPGKRTPWAAAGRRQRADGPQQGLTYGCLCGNNQRPNVSEYTLTLPYFICTEWGNQCVKACKDNNRCAAECRENNQCGATSPKKYNSTATASALTTASQTGDATTIYTDGPGGSSGAKQGGGAALDGGATCGMALLLTGLLAGFALL